MRSLRSQEEIMAGWIGSIERPLVSICCTTYNHQFYIEDALAGFLTQKTDFPFEILIHDDASSDSTADIIREYEAKYPDIIKPIYQTENQYSQGKKVNLNFNFTRAKGRYFALCEGDDYWLNLQKIALQKNILENDSTISVVFHSANELNLLTGDKNVICNALDADGYVSLKASVNGRGGFMPTASLFFRSDLLLGYYDFLAKTNLPVGDFFIQMLLSYSGKIFYINSPDCVYRRNAPGSWTDSLRNKDEKLKYSSAMAEAIVELHKLLADKKGVNYLINPLVFYSYPGFVVANGFFEKLRFFIKSIPFETKSMVFVLGYVFQFIKYSISRFLKVF